MHFISKVASDTLCHMEQPTSSPMGTAESIQSCIHPENTYLQQTKAAKPGQHSKLKTRCMLQGREADTARHGITAQDCSSVSHMDVTN